MTTRRAVRTSALMAVGLLLASCSGSDSGDNAGAPPTTTAPAVEASAGAPTSTSTAPEAAAPAGEPGSASPESSTPADIANGAPGAPGGSAVGIGSSDTNTGGGTGTTASGAAAGDSTSGTSGGAPGSSDGGSTAGSADTSSEAPTISATPAECAALRQVLAVVEHPELRALGVQAGCL